VGAAFPGVVQGGAISREELSKRVVGPANEAAMRALETIVHPLVAASRTRFLAAAAEAGEPLVVLDVPLLYETGGDAACDAVAVVSTRDAAVQRARVLARPNMTAAKLDGILARQVPDADKCARATYVLDTACAPEETRRAVAELVARCRAQ
jgi:dephospho-CoA kinase